MCQCRRGRFGDVWNCEVAGRDRLARRWVVTDEWLSMAPAGVAAETDDDDDELQEARDDPVIPTITPIKFKLQSSISLQTVFYPVVPEEDLEG